VFLRRRRYDVGMETQQTHPAQQKENGLAVASLVLGISSFIGFGALTGVPAIITGAMSMKNPYNKGLGVAGLIMGIISTALTVLAILFFIMIFIFAAAAAQSPVPDPLYEGSEPDSSSSSSFEQQI